MRKVKTKNSYNPSDSLEHPIGVSEMNPAYTMSVGQIVKRFTIPALQEMEKKSLLSYDYKDGFENIPAEELLANVRFTKPIRDYTDIESALAFAREQAQQAAFDYEEKMKALAAKEGKTLEKSFEPLPLSSNPDKVKVE